MFAYLTAPMESSSTTSPQPVHSYEQGLVSLPRTEHWFDLAHCSVDMHQADVVVPAKERDDEEETLGEFE